MKRKRDLFYDVFGRGSLPNGSVRGTSASPRHRAPGDFRISRELALVIGLLLIVFVGTSYYLGSLGGRAPGRGAELSTKDRKGRPEVRLDAGSPDEPGVEPYWAVRCLTTPRWSPKEGPKAAEDYVLKICAFLEKQEFKDVTPLRDSQARQIIVYVGRSEDPTALEAVRDRLRKLAYGSSKPFANAFVDKIDFPVK